MSTEHVVVPVEPCPRVFNCAEFPDNELRCVGCLGGSRRALLDHAVRDGDGVRVLCGSIYRDPIGGWGDCDLTFRHDGDHNSTEFTWTDDDAWVEVER